MSPWLVQIFSVACGLSVANLYYAQPMLGLIATSFGVGVTSTGLIVTSTQLGYALGLLLIVPLGDKLENRRLITTVMVGTALALLAMATSAGLPLFTAAAMLVGIFSVVAQILVPFAAHLAPEESRGRVVGQVMSGLLLGILLARAVAGVLSDYLGWRGVYGLSAAFMLAMAAILQVKLPIRQPANDQSYPQLLRSLWRIFWDEPLLRRRALYQFLMFGSFSLFWTSITFLLSAPPLRLSQTSIGLFALMGAAGALVAPAVGRLADQGRSRPVTGLSFLLGAAGFSLTLFQTNLLALAAGAVLLDVAVQTTLILGQQQIYGLRPDQRSRLNTLYIATFFVGGAAGSALSGILYASGGWPLVTALGALLPVLGLLYWLSD
jgi:predicted MFS family arabinose efflux permease